MTDDAKANDDTLVPSTDPTPITAHNEPAATNQVHAVPGDLADAGHDTNSPPADSPESLDEAIAKGDDRDRIDPTDMTSTEGVL